MRKNRVNFYMHKKASLNILVITKCKDFFMKIAQEKNSSKQ